MPSLWVGVRATALYIAVVAIGMAYLYDLPGASPPTVDQIGRFWPVQLGLVVICLYVTFRHFGWRGVGFGRMNWAGLIWLLPSFAILAAMFWALLPVMVQQPFGEDLTRLLLTFAGMAALIGFSEEVMFRGILLRSAMTRLPVIHAMLLSATAFAGLHAVSGFGGQITPDAVERLAFTFLIGFFLAPVALKIGNLWPLIIWHALWDLAVFSSDLFDLLHPFALLGMLMQVVIGLWLWAEIARGS